MYIGFGRNIDFTNFGIEMGWPQKAGTIFSSPNMTRLVLKTHIVELEDTYNKYVRAK